MTWKSTALKLLYRSNRQEEAMHSEPKLHWGKTAEAKLIITVLPCVPEKNFHVFIFLITLSKINRF